MKLVSGFPNMEYRFVKNHLQLLITILPFLTAVLGFITAVLKLTGHLA